MKLNTSITPLILLIVAGASIYWYFFTGTEQPPLSASSSKNQAQTEFQTLVGKLTPISFYTSIFSDARFNALVDLMTPIAPEPAGRLDPFASISHVDLSSVSSSSPSVNKK